METKEDNIIERALSVDRELTFTELAELAGFSNEQKIWIKTFWGATFNKNWLSYLRRC